ncbi:MAG: YkgJ family cysteine cluster protein [Desulfatiglandales bacterium]
MAEQPVDHCARCGTCCRSGSPTLHSEDVPLVLDGVIPVTSLYTIRRGEVVRDNVHGGLAVLGTERIKVRERNVPPYHTACVFYHHEDRACTIYEHRPAQCAALECWDPKAFMEVYDHPRAERVHVIEDSNILGFVEEHESLCGYPVVDRAVKSIGREGKAAVERLICIIQEDHRFRMRAVESLGIPEDALEFVLGRPLTKTLHMFGLDIKERPDGSLLLKKIH